MRGEMPTVNCFYHDGEMQLRDVIESSFMRFLKRKIEKRSGIEVTHRMIVIDSRGW